jgi:membrane protease YdiL (CAAX protease family)
MSRYFSLTRTHSYSLLFALPLLVLYEIGASYISQAGSGFRNGADVLLRTVLMLGGVSGTMALTFGLIAVALVLIVLERRRKSVPLRAAPFLGMTAESVAYALSLGFVVGAATQWILGGIPLNLAIQGLSSFSVIEGVVLSIGAGVYEELVFRVILVGGLFGIFRASGLAAGQAGVFSVLLSAIVFSAFHYIGPYGDGWTFPSFLFRFLAGVVFSVLFLLRGFGIAVWTHALYDIFLVFTLRG